MAFAYAVGEHYGVVGLVPGLVLPAVEYFKRLYAGSCAQVMSVAPFVFLASVFVTDEVAVCKILCIIRKLNPGFPCLLTEEVELQGFCAVAATQGRDVAG